MLKGQGGVRRWPGRIIASKEAPVGVEPTSSCFAGSRRAVWLQRRIGRSAPRCVSDRRLSPESSGRDLRHQNRPDFMQHFLNRFPLPHGQGSFRPSRSSSSLSPWTIRTPPLTCVSEGKPFRRLLIVSKKTSGRRSVGWPWDTSFPSRFTIVDKPRFQRPAEESNPVLQIRSLPC